MRKLVLNEQEVIAVYEKYENARQVSEVFGCSLQTIYRILKKHGVPRTHRHPKAKTKIANCHQKTRVCPALVVQLSTVAKMSDQDIAQLIGSCAGTVSRVLRQHGIARHKTAVRKSSVDVDAIEREYLAGASTYELGEKYGVNHATISKWMQKRGHCRGKGGGSKSIQWLRKGREVRKERVVKEAVERLDANPAIELIKYGSPAKVLCKKCGSEYEWGRWSWNADEPCPHCRELLRIDMHRVRDRKQYEREQQRIAAREWRLSVPRICAECGEPFYSEHERATYCCDKCHKRAKHRKNAQRGTAGGYRKRMRIVRTKATYDPSVTLDAVYKRFKGKCCACGCKVYRSKEYRPDQATLDHIVALANNGTHTWDNVQLLCSDCNSKKRDIGQMRLPIAI